MVNVDLFLLLQRMSSRHVAPHRPMAGCFLELNLCLKPLQAPPRASRALRLLRARKLSLGFVRPTCELRLGTTRL